MRRNPWTEEDIAKIKNLAGKVPASTIAGELGRTKAALVVQASKLKISLRTEQYITRPTRQVHVTTN